MRLLHTVVVAVSICLVGGCALAAGNYHSGKTLARGQRSYGLNFSANAIQFADRDNQRAWASTADSFPEVTYHRGITDDFELGGRIALTRAAAEVDVKYRLASPGSWHLTAGAALGVQLGGGPYGGSLQVPILATWERSDSVRLTFSMFGRATGFGLTELVVDQGELLGLRGLLGGAGGSFGIELTAGSITLRPSIEAAYYFAGALRFDGVEGSAAEQFAALSLVVHISKTGTRPPSLITGIIDKLRDK